MQNVEKKIFYSKIALFISLIIVFQLTFQTVAGVRLRAAELDRENRAAQTDRHETHGLD